MCGIAGIVDLAGRRPVPPASIEVMAQALVHRGPDEEGFLIAPGLALAVRRLSIVGVADGQQPISNEDGSAAVVFNGELFDYPERRRELEGRGHRFRTHCDTELIPHLWEDHQEGMFERLRGQFALALYDQARQRLVLGRDRFGICPLYWTRQGDWLLFASEVKALLATGMVRARPDLRGINHLFTFFALPGPITCFDGVQLLLPGRYLSIRLPTADSDGTPATIREHVYWEIDYPAAGDEEPGHGARQVVDEFERVLLEAVSKRLRADVPVVSYLSGGIDSSLIVAMASRLRGEPIPKFTVSVAEPGFDELSQANVVARHVGGTPIVQKCGPEEVLGTYPRLIRAAEGPVVDTSCTALLLLAQKVHDHGYKVALTGEGADEWLAGYPWYKVAKALGYLDLVPGLRLSQLARRAYLRAMGVPQFPRDVVRRAEDAMGGPNPWLDVFGVMSMAKLRFFGPPLRDVMRDHVAPADLQLNLERARRWHPLNRALYVGARTMLSGMLLLAKGDRVAMNSSVETRYPFLDEEVFAFLARLHPRWKLRGFRDKYVLRLLAERWLPREIARRPKKMFRAPFDSFHLESAPAFVNQLLSPESLCRTGYFDAEAVRHWRQAYRQYRAESVPRLSLEMGLVAVFATQLWHHTFIDGSLADLPSLSSQAPAAAPARPAVPGRDSAVLSDFATTAART